MYTKFNSKAESILGYKTFRFYKNIFNFIYNNKIKYIYNSLCNSRLRIRVSIKKGELMRYCVCEFFFLGVSTNTRCEFYGHENFFLPKDDCSVDTYEGTEKS